LLSMLAKHGDANALVLGLIGERGSEVKRPRSSSRLIEQRHELKRLELLRHVTRSAGRSRRRKARSGSSTSWQ
jgi:flagellar biosynthesis/type III secretory pathway ATPase